MPRLLLIRHAKAAPGPSDLERPLTDEGGLQAVALGAWLAQAGLVPDRVLVSPARRAWQTWERARASLGGSAPPIVDPRIYDNSVETLLAAIRETPENVHCLVLVGHNPSIAALATALDDGRGNPDARRKLENGFPAGAAATFVVATPWAVIAPGAAELSDVAVPGDGLTRPRPHRG